MGICLGQEAESVLPELNVLRIEKEMFLFPDTERVDR